jgi:UDP-N-acetylglucosamine 2-epimerase (non-hydrolysing)
MSKKKIYVVIGTRAQLIKMAPIMVLMQKENIDYEFIYTAQHKETISEILSDFNVKMPDRILYSKSEAKTITKFLGWIGSMLFQSLSPKKIFPEKGIVLTHGDTATCIWAAIVGKLAGCIVCHVESGLRSFNIFQPFPEELTRLITFRFSDVYFCPNSWAVNNLKKYNGDKVNLEINTLYDSVKEALTSNESVDYPNEKYAVVSIHRLENIFTKKFEQTIIPLLENVAEKGFVLVFVLHPATLSVLKRNEGKLYKRLESNKRIVLKDRYSYFKFIKLLNGSQFVISDGGSNQEELSYLGKPTLLFRNVTERIEGLKENIVISNFDEHKIMNFVENYKNFQRPIKEISISPSEKIITYLKCHFLAD